MVWTLLPCALEQFVEFADSDGRTDAVGAEELTSLASRFPFHLSRW